jgi:predicted alpha/beta-hydrolase family hydrolase
VTDHAVLVSTSAGPTAGVVSEPDGERRAALLLLQGDGPPARAGVNAVWTRLARSLADQGIVVLRVDLATHGDGSMIARDFDPKPDDKEDVDATVLSETAAWFAERLDGLDLYVAGECRGGRLAIELTPYDLDLAGLLLVVPYLRNKFQPQDVRDEHTARLDDVDVLHDGLLDGLRDLIGRGGLVWVLMGERDGQDALRLRAALGPAGDDMEIAVVPGANVHPSSLPEPQRHIEEQVSARLLAAVREREAVA